MIEKYSYLGASSEDGNNLNIRRFNGQYRIDIYNDADEVIAYSLDLAEDGSFSFENVIGENGNYTFFGNALIQSNLMLCLQVNERKHIHVDQPNEKFSSQLIFKIGDILKDKINNKEGRILSIDSNIEIMNRKCSLTYISDKISAIKSNNEDREAMDETTVMDLEEDNVSKLTDKQKKN